MFRNRSALLIAGLCLTTVAYAESGSSVSTSDVDRIDQAVTADVDAFRGDTSSEHWRSGDGTGEHERNAVSGRTAAAEAGTIGLAPGPQVAGTSERIESRSEIRSDRDIKRTEVAASEPAKYGSKDTSDKADRAGPVPFADLGQVGTGDQTLSDPKAIEQDKALLAKGEISGDDLVIHLPAGAIKNTISLRSGNGLDLSTEEIQKLGRFDGDDLHLSLSDVRQQGSDDLGNLWLWGTGPESASLLQRIAIDGNADREVASAPSRSLRSGSTTLGAPIRESSEKKLNEPNMMSSDKDDGASRIDQENKERAALRSAGMEKSASDKETNTF